MGLRAYLIGQTDLVYLKEEQILSHRINKNFEFSMGHTLNNYQGACHRLHGHNYQLEVMVKSEGLDKSGFVMDFGDLKDVVNGILDQEYDHYFLVDEKDSRAEKLKTLGALIVPFEPTAENLVISIATRIQRGLPGVSIVLEQVTLWETSTSKAVWTGHD